MKFITKHIKFIIAFVISFALTLIFVEQLSDILLKVSKEINYHSKSFIANSSDIDHPIPI